MSTHESRGEQSFDNVFVPPLNFSRLQREHKTWADKNFGTGTNETKVLALFLEWADSTFSQGSTESRAIRSLLSELRVLRSFLGVVEEVGELSHAMLKQSQGIRGTYDEHEEAGKDAVADTIIFLTDVCNRKGWNLQEIMESTWDVVKHRDWTRNKTTGEATPNAG